MTPPFRFGRAEVRPSERELLFDGQPAALGARAFDVLCHLIAHRDRVVGKAELLEAVWPGLVVEENNLQVQISALRKLLGANVIKTVPGQGYQFTAPLEADRPTPASPGADSPAPNSRPVATRRLLGLAASVSLLLAVGAGAWMVSRPKANAPAQMPAAGSGDASADRSIAVLPFVDMSEKKDQEYFSDGLSEELINLLAHTADLKVIARTSSFQFKGRSEDVRSIGQKLAVANLLEGSVRTSGRTIRVTAQLIRASDGSHRWSQTYDRDMSDIFKVQDAIAGAVVTALKATMSAGPSPAAKDADTQAYNALLRGRYFLQRRTKDDLERAIAAFKEAIRIQPGYALAWTELSSAYNNRALTGWVPAKEGYAEAREAADRALQLDPRLPQAHRALAVLEWNYNFDFARARLEDEQAHELDPADTTVTNSACMEPLGEGNPDKAIAFCRRAVERDPLNASRHYDLGLALYDAGRLDEAEKVTRGMLELNPSYAGGQCFLGSILLAKNQAEAALAAITKEPDDRLRGECLPDVLWALGRREEADRLLDLVKRNDAGVAAYGIAESYAKRNDSDAAFEWLDRAYRNREPPVTLMRSDPDLKYLHDDPRYAAFLRRLKLPG